MASDGRCVCCLPGRCPLCCLAYRIHFCPDDRESLPDYIQFKPNPGTPLRDIFTAAGDDLLDILRQMVTLCPTRRINAENALRHSYFSNKPAPSRGENLPLPASIQQTKKEVEKPGIKRKILDTDSNPFAKKLVF